MTAGPMRMGVPGSLGELLGGSVRVGGVRVGEVAGVLVDRSVSRTIGLEVSSAGGARRFVPWFAVGIQHGGITVDSAFLLVDGIDGYERLGAVTLREPSALVLLRAGPDGRVEEHAENARQHPRGARAAGRRPRAGVPPETGSTVP